MKIEQLSVDTDLTAVAGLYAQVFAGPPWNEVSVCPVCGNFSANQPGTLCTCSKSILDPAYPPLETASYIQQELTKPLAIGLIGLANNEPIAFGWAYESNGAKFAASKYKIPANQELIAQACGVNTEYFYISEVGVNPINQGQGYGSKLTLQLADNQPNILLRTNADSGMRKIAETKLKLNPIIAPWLTTKDPENENRVIYVSSINVK